MRVPPNCEYFAKDAAPPEAEKQVAELAFRYGECYSSYVAAEDGWETFFGPDRCGVVRFTRWLGYYVYNASGLLAAPEDRARLLEHFRRFLDLNRLNGLFICIGRDQLPLFREQGCQVSKNGEEPLVRLETATWRGKEFEWLRRQENYCLRQNLDVVEIDTDPSDPDYRETIVPQLEEVSREHIEATLHGFEMRYFVGRFTPFAMGHKRLFAAVRGDHIEAFIVCTPCLAGTMWAIEMYRKRNDATRGVMPFTMLQIMRRLKEEGVAWCSLSLIPAVRATRITGDHWAAGGWSYMWWNYFNWAFDVRGIYHFKSRFRPDSREMYYVSWPRTTLLSMLGCGRVWGIYRLSPWRLLKRFFQWAVKRDARQTLAEPAFRPSRVIRSSLSRPEAVQQRPADAPEQLASEGEPVS